MLTLVETQADRVSTEISRFFNPLLVSLEGCRTKKAHLHRLVKQQMKPITNLLTSLILAAWVGAIAILSVQNFSYVYLKFLAFQSIQIPAGLVLAFSAGAGMVGGAILPILWQAAGSQQQRQSDDIGEENNQDF